MSYKICSEVEIVKKNYDDPIVILEGLEHKQKDIIKMVEFYGSSKYLNGQRDELGRAKAFYQILNGMCDVENAAKDIDTKDINVVADDPKNYITSFLLSKDIYQWMKQSNFALTLNEMKKTHTRYGSLLVKKCIEKEEDGTKVLEIEIPEWKNLITDQVDIEDGTIIETHYMTPIEILKMTEWSNTDELVAKAIKKGGGKRIAVYEVRGEFPRSYIKEMDKKKASDGDEKDFSYQLFYLGGEVETNKAGKVSGDKLIPLYWEDDTERVYKYLARKPKSGRAFGVGVFEEGEEAQVQINNAILKQNRALEYTAKVLGQSASKKLKGRNMFNEVDDGQILEHEDGKPITPLQLMPTGGLTQFQGILEQWYQQLERTTSAFSAQRGEAPPAGTPFRLQAVVLQQSSSVFQELQEELGIFVTEIFNDWIMPHLASTLNKEHILAHSYSIEELKWMDKNLSENEANDREVELILSGENPTPEQKAGFVQDAMTRVNQTQGTRFIQLLKNEYKKAPSKVTINITGEQKNKAAILESLNTILMTYAKAPNIGTDPVLSQLFMKLVELSGAGISPVSLMTALAQNTQASVAPGGQPPVPGQPVPQPSPLSLQANPMPQNA